MGGQDVIMGGKILSGAVQAQNNWGTNNRLGSCRENFTIGFSPISLPGAFSQYDVIFSFT